ncbi:serine/threonine-protein kinase [Clostridium estertheticum]|uniref:non-specific serine/threonine protein kinase n=1 Tax=Clostridium estertheticum TaxID=238834 RepID=A0AA47EEH8_9CLOT|nr:serine/threonine-protein kinase [Clostridium estertheticum]MBU3156100.1 serine/threonine protein kinase [Clostridium estertheticum]WAG58541.1 serine/threonine protein kinase [Clostridium estertheticum]
MLSSGDILYGKYEVIRTLGKGGMGVVYLCKNIILGNLWAIKEVIQDKKNIDILTEANILKNLNHPGIRKIIDTFYSNNNLYMVQDYVDGQTLKEYVKANGIIQIEKICRIVSDLCDIIGYLHNQNPVIIYRDIKPSNIMIMKSGKVVLIDFGISKVYKNDMSQDIDMICAGSNGYAAPEQYGSGKCCMQTDIYGIGMLIYFMVKGRTPYTGIEPLLDENYGPEINNKLKKIIQKCVKIDINERYALVGNLKEDISNILPKNESVITKKVNINIKIINKSMYDRSIRVFFCFTFAIVASIYILYGNKKESTLSNTADAKEIVSPIVISSSIEQNSIKEFIKKPTRRIRVVPIKGISNSITQ